MKPSTRLLVVLACALLMAACGGGSSAPEVSESATVEPAPTATAEPVVDEPTPEPEPTEAPTPEPVALTDDEMIAAAQAAFAADPGDLIAWDDLDAVVFGDRVRLTICGWTGDTVFDNVRIVEYEVVNDEGVPSASFIFDGNTAEECLNQELVASALAFTTTYNAFWDSVRADPSVFTVEEGATLMTEPKLAASQSQVDGWISDGLRWSDHEFPGDIVETSPVEVLWRRYEVVSQDIFELAACVVIEPDFGLYQGDLLVNNFRNGATGEHLVRRFLMERESGQWRMSGVNELAWSNCGVDGSEAWNQEVTDWQPEPVPWQVLDDA